MALFEVRNLSFSYPECSEKAIENLSMTVESGEFLLLCGASGCGKSTLLRHLKPSLTPHGARSGEILFCGQPLGELSLREQAEKIGFVTQSPENQIVTDKVWHEIAFGLESLGLDTPTIRVRVAETAAFFGIENWFYQNTAHLSGGQKQLLNLASVMVMQPEVLILDEPTSQLDPIAASEFLSALGKINRELGTTILLTEHRLEEAFPLANRVVWLEKGSVLCSGSPCEVGMYLKENKNKMFPAMPAPMRIWSAVESSAPCPVTIAEGRSWLSEYAKDHKIKKIPEKKEPVSLSEKAIELKDVWFRYEKDGEDILKGLNLSVGKGEFFAILGGNGTGKTTALKLIAELKKPYRGSVSKNGVTATLPQNPQALFVKKTVREDLFEVFAGTRISKAEKEKRVEAVSALCKLNSLLDRHPYDLSGGESQRAALAKVLLIDPDILLLDEPTKGFDAEFKAEFSQILKTLSDRGVTILMVSHDIEFSAANARRCALFFDGAIVTQGTPQSFFAGNRFYTTSANRMARDILPQAITAEDVIFACGGTIGSEKEEEKSPPLPLRRGEVQEKAQQKKLPIWRKLITLLSFLLSLVIFLHATGTADFSSLLSFGEMTSFGADQMKLYAVLILSLFVCALATYHRSEAFPQSLKTPRKLSKRTAVASVLVLLLVPLTLFFGVFYLERAQYYITALLVLFECMIPFFLVFEGRKPQARELVIIASLCAIGIAGRAVFFMLPQFKPVAALTVIAGIAFGGETGFLVGAMTMLLSNMLFSQGPWTPFQMFAMGLIGFLAGILFRRGGLSRAKISITVFGVLSVIVIFGGIMNPASALIWGRETLNSKIILTYYLTGLPMDLVHAAATAIFLWFGAEPMLEKLDRVKLKYGLIE